jgi:hypothetical protein
MSLPLPSAQETEVKLVALADGSASREEVADWASPWVIGDDIPRDYDRRVWNALLALCGADLKDTPTTYLHGAQNFRDWLAEFRNTKP